MPVTQTFTYPGQLRCEATHGPSGHALVTDAPTDNHGRGETFSPTDLLVTSLVTCMMTVMGIKADKNGWDLQGITATATKHMIGPPRQVGRIEVAMHVPGDWDERARKVLRKTAEDCPVALSLAPSVQVELVMTWGDPA